MQTIFSPDVVGFLFVPMPSSASLYITILGYQCSMMNVAVLGKVVEVTANQMVIYHCAEECFCLNSLFLYAQVSLS